MARSSKGTTNKKNPKKTSGGNWLAEGAALGASLVASAAAGYFLFGPNGKQNRKKVRGWTLKAKGEILEKLENLNEVSEAKYKDIVDQVVNRYSKAKDRTQDEIARFEKEAKKYWKSIEKDLANKKGAGKSKGAKKSTTSKNKSSSGNAKSKRTTSTKTSTQKK